MIKFDFMKNQFILKYASLVPDVWQALNEIPRTGWVNRKVKNPESVQEHTVSTSCTQTKNVKYRKGSKIVFLML